MNYFVNIGSNLGNRSLNLSRAVKAIASRYGWFDVSHTVESEPWGFKSPHRFLNVCVTFVTEEKPAEVLRAMQEIEKQLGGGKAHRHADGSYADRALDIDIIAADELKIDEPDLQVPHPRLPDRDFFLEPLAELAPGWHHPDTGLTPVEMLSGLRAKEKSKD